MLLLLSLLLLHALYCAVLCCTVRVCTYARSMWLLLLPLLFVCMEGALASTEAARELAGRQTLLRHQTNQRTNERTNARIGQRSSKQASSHNYLLASFIHRRFGLRVVCVALRCVAQWRVSVVERPLPLCARTASGTERGIHKHQSVSVQLDRSSQRCSLPLRADRKPRHRRCRLRRGISLSAWPLVPRHAAALR